MTMIPAVQTLRLSAPARAAVAAEMLSPVGKPCRVIDLAGRNGGVTMWVKDNAVSGITLSGSGVGVTVDTVRDLAVSTGYKADKVAVSRVAVDGVSKTVAHIALA